MNCAWCNKPINLPCPPIVFAPAPERCPERFVLALMHYDCWVNAAALRELNKATVAETVH